MTTGKWEILVQNNKEVESTKVMCILILYRRNQINKEVFGTRNLNCFIFMFTSYIFYVHHMSSHLNILFKIIF